MRDIMEPTGTIRYRQEGQALHIEDPAIQQQDQQPTAESDTEPLETQQARVRNRAGVIGLNLACCLGFLSVNLVAARAMREPIPAMIVLSILAAELTMISVWGTLVRGTFWIRLPWSMLMLVVSWAVLCTGAKLFGHSRHYPETAFIDTTVQVALLWSVGFLFSFLPLKIAAIGFGWHISPNTGRARETERRYAIRDVLLGTGLLAVVMGVARAFVPDDNDAIAQSLAKNVLQQTELMIAMSIFGVASLMIKMPAIWIGFAGLSKKLGAHVLWLSLFCFILTMFEFGLICSVVGMSPAGGQLWLGLTMGHLLMAGVVLVVCLGLQKLGYCLRSRAMDSAHPTTTPLNDL